MVKKNTNRTVIVKEFTENLRDWTLRTLVNEGYGKHEFSWCKQDSVERFSYWSKRIIERFTAVTERVFFLADVLSSVSLLAVTLSHNVHLALAVYSFTQFFYTFPLLVLPFPGSFFFELEQIGNLVLRQNLKNVSCSSSAHSPDAFRRKDLPAFLDIKIRP